MRVPRIELKRPWSDGDYSRVETIDGYRSVAHSGRLLTLHLQTWHTDDDPRLLPNGEDEREPDSEMSEVYFDPTPVFVAEELRKRGVGFRNYTSGVSAIGETWEGTASYYGAGGMQDDRVTAFLSGFTPLQLKIINAHVDAIPGRRIGVK